MATPESPNEKSPFRKYNGFDDFRINASRTIGKQDGIREQMFGIRWHGAIVAEFSLQKRGKMPILRTLGQTEGGQFFASPDQGSITKAQQWLETLLPDELRGTIQWNVAEFLPKRSRMRRELTPTNAPLPQDVAETFLPPDLTDAERGLPVDGGALSLREPWPTPAPLSQEEAEAFVPHDWSDMERGLPIHGGRVRKRYEKKERVQQIDSKPSPSETISTRLAEEIESLFEKQIRAGASGTIQESFRVKQDKVAEFTAFISKLNAARSHWQTLAKLLQRRCAENEQSRIAVAGLLGMSEMTDQIAGPAGHREPLLAGTSRKHRRKLAKKEYPGLSTFCKILRETFDLSHVLQNPRVSRASLEMIPSTNRNFDTYERMVYIDYLLQGKDLATHIKNMGSATIVDGGSGATFRYPDSYIRTVAALNPQARVIGFDPAYAGKAGIADALGVGQFTTEDVKKARVEGMRLESWFAQHLVGIKSESVDVYVSANMFDKIPANTRALETAFLEAARILKPGGELRIFAGADNVENPLVFTLLNSGALLQFPLDPSQAPLVGILLGYFTPLPYGVITSESSNPGDYTYSIALRRKPLPYEQLRKIERAVQVWNEAHPHL